MKWRRQFERIALVWLSAVLLCAAASSSVANGLAVHTNTTSGVSGKHIHGCHDGWHRVGTMKDPTLHRTWAVVTSCGHPAWPAHLEPEGDWQELAPWVPAGSSVVVASPDSMTLMRLHGKTVTPGRVGRIVIARLANGERVRVKLTGRNRAEMASITRWR